MTDRLCEGCGNPLGPGRPDRKHHGPACRNMAWRRRQAGTAPVPVMVMPSPDPSAVLAEALSENNLLIPIVHAARTQWRASAWLLERRYPERWGHGEPPGRCPTATWSGG